MTALKPAGLDVRWHAGWPSAKHDPAPEIQVHAFDESTLILRQNMSVHFEAPFLFLLFGSERALLIDTGATEDPAYFPLRRVVDEAVTDWLELHPRPGYGLVVAHTHGHGDHIAGDGQFTDRPDTVVVGPSPEAVRDFYGLAAWPEGSAEVDLGGRVVDVLPGPGHEPAATVFHDRRTGLLFTGDTLYPGHLYIRDLPAYSATVDRLLAFCERHPVSHLLGCHVEMTTTPGDDYPRGTTHQPDEPPLQMSAGRLRDLRRALAETGGRPGVHRFDHFLLHIEGDV
ncbi:MBL fold metallo-hydrolase [Actinacidiphila acidipaludis]|uniref:MBL fold metallo-hydrolase n=1 Tax=Actinacidiphila acidipaludis TaxID=2873382 RepID=A0ABS7QAJ2_9ACTN|nr:MBL fold metallo-hydrolase [Streptomyces acidipaludis]MBY8878789.1 MBL fold metallo-hydrolase [Streptomyces acidipaludis]